METVQTHNTARTITLYNGVEMPLLGRTSVLCRVCKKTTDPLATPTDLVQCCTLYGNATHIPIQGTEHVWAIQERIWSALVTIK